MRPTVGGRPGRLAKRGTASTAAPRRGLLEIRPRLSRPTLNFAYRHTDKTVLDAGAVATPRCLPVPPAAPRLGVKDRRRMTRGRSRRCERVQGSRSMANVALPIVGLRRVG
jgi:hypothetical protein